LPGNYTNPTFGNGNIWKEEDTIKISNLVGTTTTPIVIHALVPGTAVLKGDGATILNT
jgi:hypothetical protein